jgi:hypothetical protein
MRMTMRMIRVMGDEGRRGTDNHVRVKNREAVSWELGVTWCNKKDWS